MGFIRKPGQLLGIGDLVGVGLCAGTRRGGVTRQLSLGGALAHGRPVPHAAQGNGAAGVVEPIGGGAIPLARRRGAPELLNEFLALKLAQADRDRPAA